MVGNNHMAFEATQNINSGKISNQTSTAILKKYAMIGSQFSLRVPQL